MRIFISYRFTGVPIDEIWELLNPAIQTLESLGHTVFQNLDRCDFYETNNYTTRMIMDECLDELRRSDAQLILVNHPTLSEGMLLEQGAAWQMGKPIYLLNRRGIGMNTSATVVKQRIEFDRLDEIPGLIEKLIF